MTTSKDGRIDIVIFANGGREIIGRIDSEPRTPEELYKQEIESFVAGHQNLEMPERFTGIYSVVDDTLSISWGEYQGEIEHEEEEFTLPDEIFLPESQSS